MRCLLPFCATGKGGLVCRGGLPFSVLVSQSHLMLLRGIWLLAVFLLGRLTALAIWCEMFVLFRARSSLLLQDVVLLCDLGGLRYAKFPGTSCL